MRRALLLVALIAAVVLLPAAPTNAQDPPSDVYVVHGLDLGAGPGGLPVTVCVDDAVILPDLTTGQVEGPLELDPATYNVEVTLGADTGCDAPTLQEDFDVPSRASLSIVAYYLFDVGPTLGAFVNNVDCVEADTARVTARHTANAGPVDVFADGEVLFGDVASGEGDDADVPAGTYTVGVELVGGGVVIADTDVDLEAAVNTIIYVIGASDSEPSVLVQTIDLDVCEQPTTTTAPPVAPTPLAPAAAPATAVTATPQRHWLTSGRESCTSV